MSSPAAAPDDSFGKSLFPPPGLKFSGAKENWRSFKLGMTTWLRVVRLDKFLENPRPQLGAASKPQGGASESAASASAASAGSSSAAAKTVAKSEQLDSEADEAAALVWHEKAQRVFFALLYTTSGAPQVARLVSTVAEGDAHALWTKLLAKYESKSLANQNQLWSALTRATMNPEKETIDGYATRLQSLEKELLEQNSKVDETQMKCNREMSHSHLLFSFMFFALFVSVTV
jgi:hypothetical protein